MPQAPKTFPVIDLFAGPGGLGEGFASFSGADGEPRFESVVAIEQDEPSYQTLLLRHFLRQFPDQQFPDDYYKYLRREIPEEFDEAFTYAALRKAEGLGRPVGSREWLEDMAKQSGMPLLPGKRGPKSKHI